MQLGVFMKFRIATVFLFFAVAPAAHAFTVNDDTPARAITIGKMDGSNDRVVIAKEVISMKECREALEENAEALKENSVAILCVPADMRDPGAREGINLPLVMLNEK